MGLSADDLLARLRESFGDRILASSNEHGEATVEIGRDAALEVFAALRDRAELEFNFLIDLTAVDYLGQTPRFAVVYHLFSLPQNHRLRVRIRVPEDEAWVHSLVGLWKSANWIERECWDMFGIRFDGHPDPRRILLDDAWEGHPLLKSYAVDTPHPPYR